MKEQFTTLIVFIPVLNEALLPDTIWSLLFWKVRKYLDLLEFNFNVVLIVVYLWVEFVGAGMHQGSKIRWGR